MALRAHMSARGMQATASLNDCLDMEAGVRIKGNRWCPILLTLQMKACAILTSLTSAKNSTGDLEYKHGY